MQAYASANITHLHHRSPHYAILSMFCFFVCSGRAARQASEELLELLIEGGGDAERAQELVQQLSKSRQPFKEQLLGGGPWQVSSQADHS